MVATWVNGQIVFNGVVQGAVYGLLALSIVLVYRSSKVINFAAGNIGLIGSGVLVLLDVRYGMPFWPALLLGLAAGVVFGAIVELTVVRRLFAAPRVIMFVATIGVAQLCLGILAGFPEITDPRATYPTPIGGDWHVGSVRIKGVQLVVLIVTPILAAGLAWFLNRTLAGRAVRAAAANPDLARLSEINPKVMSTIVWSIGGLVGTLAMMLIGGINGSATNVSELGPSSLLRAMTAALIARFRSFPIALAVGVAIGLGETLVQFNYIAQPGLADVLLLVVVLVAVALRSSDRSAGDSVFAYGPRVEALPQRLAAVWWVRNLNRIAMLALLAVAIVAPLVITQPSRQLLYASIASFVICTLSLTVLTGWAGQLSLGQMAFAGVGALTAAAFTRGLEIDLARGDTQIFYLRVEPLPYVLSIVLAMAVTAVLAAIVGSGALRVHGLLLAVSTFAFAIAAGAWLYRTHILSGGNTASVPFSRGSPFGLDLSRQRTFYYFVLGALTLVVAVLGRLRRSGVGRVTLAVRDNSNTAAAYTVRPSVAKLRAFALAGAIAGLGGALLAGSAQQIAFGDDRFLVSGSLDLVAMAVIGGMSSISGAILGAIWVIGLPALVPGNEIVPLLTSSMGLLVLLMYFPGGFAHVLHRARGGLYRYLEAKLPPVEKQATAPPASVRPATSRADVDVPLRANGIVVQFGGVRANDVVSLEVRRGEIVGLIGTNGAGKTTLMNAIGGFVAVAEGRVELLGRDVTGLEPAGRARLGLGRTFQAATLFPELTVRETIEVALEARGRSGLVETVLFSPRQRARARTHRREAAELVDFLGLGRYAERVISELSTGTRRIVELAGLLALDARVLCLDEPTAGIAQREAEAMGPLLVEIRRQLGAAMLIIEHDMPLIMGMSDRVYCLEQGRVIAEGAPEDVRNDPAVIASYLGTNDAAIARSGVVAEPVS